MISVRTEQQRTNIRCFGGVLQNSWTTKTLSFCQKCKFVLKEIKWCRRNINGKGYRMDSHRMDIIKNLAATLTAAELCGFVYFCWWMSSAIPKFVQLCKPLNEVLEEAYIRSGGRKKRPLKKIGISTLSWAQKNTGVRAIRRKLTSVNKIEFPKEGLDCTHPHRCLRVDVGWCRDSESD